MKSKKSIDRARQQKIMAAKLAGNGATHKKDDDLHDPESGKPKGSAGNADSVERSMAAENN